MNRYLVPEDIAPGNLAQGDGAFYLDIGDPDYPVRFWNGEDMTVTNCKFYLDKDGNVLIVGTLSAGEIHIPNETDDGFHVESDGTVRIGDPTTGQRFEVVPGTLTTLSIYNGANTKTGTLAFDVGSLQASLSSEASGNVGTVQTTAGTGRLISDFGGTQTTLTVGLGVVTLDTSSGTEVVVTLGSGTATVSTGQLLGDIRPTYKGARVYRNTAQTLTTGTAAAVSFDAESFDTDTLHDNATNPTRLTAHIGGKWRISTTVSFDPNVTGMRRVFFRKNGTTSLAECNAAPNPTAAQASSVHLSTTESLAATDYIEVMARQDSGGDLDIDEGVNRTWAVMEYVGA